MLSCILIATIGQYQGYYRQVACPTQSYAIQTQWLPPYQIYGSVVADNQANVQTNNILNTQLSKLDASINKLEARLVAATAPVQGPAPSPQVPLKSQPRLPSKQTPEFSQPILPDKQIPIGVDPRQFNNGPLPNKGNSVEVFNNDQVPPPPLKSSNTVQAVGSIFANRCKNCHSADRYQTSGGGFKIFDEDGLISRNLTIIDKLKIDDQIYNGVMPKDSTPLSPDDYDVVRAWVNEDRDGIRALIRSVSR